MLTPKLKWAISIYFSVLPAWLAAALCRISILISLRRPEAVSWLGDRVPQVKTKDKQDKDSKQDKNGGRRGLKETPVLVLLLYIDDGQFVRHVGHIFVNMQSITFVRSLQTIFEPIT